MADSKEKSGDNNTEKVADGMSAMKIKQIEDEVASSYLLVDIGANLTNSKYSRDLDSVVERAKDAGISFWSSPILHPFTNEYIDRSEENHGDRRLSSVQ